MTCYEKLQLKLILFAHIHQWTLPGKIQHYYKDLCQYNIMDKLWGSSVRVRVRTRFIGHIMIIVQLKLILFTHIHRWTLPGKIQHYYKDGHVVSG